MKMAVEKVDLGEDDGFLVIAVAGVEVQVDVFATNNLIFAHHEKNKARPDAEYNDGLCSLIETLGFPRLSHRLAQVFVKAVSGKVEQLKNGPTAPPS